MICSVASCDAPAKSRGMCNRHYSRWRAYGDPETPPRVVRSRYRWTANDLYEIETGIEAGYSDETIARRLRCSVDALRLARKRHGLRSRTDMLMSARAVAALLGIGCAKSVVQWLKQGWLRGRQGTPRGENRRWLVREEHLLAFLQDETHWHRWQPERITEPGLREWTLEMRAGVRYLTPSEVAERCYVTQKAVNNWIRSGILPAVRHGNYMVRESDLEGFVPLGQRSKVGVRQRAWSADDDRTLVAMRRSGASFAAIARALGRTIGAVSNRWYRITEVPA